VLAAAGYVTVTAADGPEALTTCESTESFDLLVTDFMMPAMDGAELARQVRRARPSMKVLYLTGYSDALFDAKGQLWCDEAFLEKPCTPDGLVEAVSLLVNDRTVQKTVWS
jgi:CheY-like chemotaxis protein